MTGLRLFLRSRRTAALLVSLLGTALVVRAIGDRTFLLGEEVPLAVPWAAFLPLVSAYTVAGSAMSPLPWLEYAAKRRMALWRRGHLVTAGASATALVWFATSQLPPPLSSAAAVRNFFGLLGLSLIAITFLGGAGGWVVPCGAVFAAMVMRNGDDHFVPLDWLLAGAGDRGAVLAALILLAGGAVVTWSRRFLLRDAGVE